MQNQDDLLELLKRHLQADYDRIKNALDDQHWERLSDANHTLLGALLYCDVPPLKQASLALRAAPPDQLVCAAKNLLSEIARAMA